MASRAAPCSSASMCARLANPAHAVKHNVSAWFAQMRGTPLMSAGHMPERSPAVVPKSELGSWQRSELTKTVGHIGCANTATSLCIDGRYLVTTGFNAGSQGSGSGQSISLASLGVSQGGLFWFFGQSNPEMLIKIIDGCSLNNQHWVFFSAGTNVGLQITVTDLLSTQSRTYTNALGTAAQPVQDTSALPCP